MPLAAGSVFAGFTIVRQLGAGGMGEVYLVEHPRLPRREAMKILPTSITTDAEYRQRFVREADLAAEMWHPHIVAVHDRGEFDGQLWITMDYVEGTDAAQLVRERFPAGLPAHFAAEIVGAVADALDHAHERGLLHRDVKPANILVTDSDPASRRRRILLSDFGIARRMDDASGLTATNMTVGSIAYSAPEQLTGSPMDGRADQYALAATAFQLLTGKPPFENSNAAVVIGSHLTAPPPKMADRRPDLAALDAVIAKGMAKQPADRYATCSDFAHALAELAEAKPRTDDATMIGAPRPPVRHIAPQIPPPEQTPAPAPVAATEPPRKRRKTGFIAAAAIVVAALVAGGVFIALRGSDSTSEKSAGSSKAASSNSAAPNATGAQGDSSLVPASAIDSLLLTAAQLQSVTGYSLDAASSSNGVLDASGYFDRPECSPAIYPAEDSAYGGSGFTAVRQSLLQTPEGSSYLYIVDQSVALLPSAERATALRDDAQQLWQSCAGAALTITDPNGTVRATLQDVEVRDNAIVQDRSVDDGVSPRYGCQHTMAVWSNVVAETVVCADVEVGDRSVAIVDEILANAERK